VSLSPEAMKRLLDHARAELPNEACALLGGEEAPGRITSVHLARNNLASSYRYDVDADDLVRIVHDIEARGEALVAIFHSHPGTEAVPSATDLRESRYPVVHLVASLVEPGAPIMRAWRISQGRAREVPLRVGEAPAG